ncbi:hypothetical protein CL634_06040 [bacterium]|nr:hypothetical protein [bacterium]|tara:strand:- start:875 stop:1105 length:231 start_codon:yes stop_codon:yes gene_type:complete
MDKEATHTMFVNGLCVEVYNQGSGEDFWGDKKIYIYDCLSDLSNKEKEAIIDYLYSEGFIDDRRTGCEVIRGEDYL